jgi:large subunit ribosomal protein L18
MYLYTQAIDDGAGAVLTAASTRESTFKEKSKNVKNIKAAELLGETLARRLKDKKIASVVFDRGIHPYHGRIKALADAMRKQGIQF